MERSESGQGRVKERCDAKKEGAAWDSWSAASGELLVGGARRADSVAMLAVVCACWVLKISSSNLSRKSRYPKRCREI